MVIEPNEMMTQVALKDLWQEVNSKTTEQLATNECLIADQVLGLEDQGVKVDVDTLALTGDARPIMNQLVRADAITVTPQVDPSLLGFRLAAVLDTGYGQQFFASFTFPYDEESNTVITSNGMYYRLTSIADEATTINIRIGTYSSSLNISTYPELTLYFENLVGTPISDQRVTSVQLLGNVPADFTVSATGGNTATLKIYGCHRTIATGVANVGVCVSGGGVSKRIALTIYIEFFGSTSS